MKKILIIEDDTFLGDILFQKLIREGYQVVLVEDGKIGFEKIKSFGPDLILLDIALPHMNGYEILEAKLKDPEISGIPVIVISNSGQEVEINHLISLGVKDYMIKTEFKPEEVLSKVREKLSEHEKSSDPLFVSSETLSSEEISNINLKGKKVLLVEDDKFLSEIIAHKLASTKCTLFSTQDGKKVLDIVSKEVPDIVVLDIILPGINGFEILQKIKSDPKIKNIPVIILSNLGQESDIKKCKDLGATIFMIKATVTPNEIVNEVEKILMKK
jgi:DNA-binding response OmpR family regulator